MDIFAHGLWAAAGAHGLNLKKKNKLSVAWVTFWGIFPDLFAFTPVFTVLFWNLIFQKSGLRGGAESAFASLGPLTSHLYSISHSLIVFAIIFAAVALIKKCSVWELSGWLLHILIDIPSHSKEFYPTPFLWPVSRFEVSGYSWAHPVFLALNYFAIISVYILLSRRRNKKRT